ncbi:hypothetical protein [Leucobacter aridicollis]|uniref:Uncharacterized protein n=1 Tax=Leucobacter aridicollis TaxID=283878 RepID=A0A852R7P9_9MICO|nr:hypothetical protein [Leucobacter aridicollis]MBL3682034.1 hypothetical protein [Leucobacter aridicollis]NYD26918.1 hypothetical protein [Leucobacter aridicollis]
MKRGGIRALLGAGVLAALALGIGAPAQAVEPEAAEAPAVPAEPEWDPEVWLIEQWPRLPFGDRAELELTDLSEGRELPSGAHQSLAGFVSVDYPDVVQLDREYVSGVPWEARRALRALAVHELTHAAVFQSGTVPEQATFAITEADSSWAAPLLNTGLPGKWAALEAIAACVEQAGIAPDADVYYLSGPCPPAYRDAAFEYLEEITGTDWRPRELRPNIARALGAL